MMDRPPLPDSPQDSIGGAGALRIMVVEDEEALREVTVEVLARAGYQPVSAEHGLEAVERFKQAPDQFALVILDLTMPHMDGATCLRHLRSLQPEVRVLLTTGHQDPDIGPAAGGEKPTGFLAKPYRISDLLKAVQAALADS